MSGKKHQGHEASKVGLIQAQFKQQNYYSQNYCYHKLKTIRVSRGITGFFKDINHSLSLLSVQLKLIYLPMLIVTSFLL